MKPHGESGKYWSDSCLDEAELGSRADDKTCHDMTLSSLNDLDAEPIFEGWLEG
jgi:hypothetical protein